MIVRLFIIKLLSIFGYNFNKPVRLEKQETKSKFQIWADKSCPYIITIGIIILAIILFIILAKYGAQITGTESNQYYYGSWRH